jgi:hypothetical protein
MTKWLSPVYTADCFLSANAFVVLIAATNSMSSVLNRWRSDPSENDMHFRIFDVSQPAHASIIKITFLKNELVQLTGPGQVQIPHGSWNSAHDTTIDASFIWYHNPIQLQFQLIDNTDSFQDIRTPEVLLIPWVQSQQPGPTRANRQQHR